MTFSKEDRAAWADSEVMKELEKVAKNIDLEEKSWEEDDDTEKLIDAVEEFEEPKEEEEKSFDQDEMLDALFEAHGSDLLVNIEKISYKLIDKSNIKGAYKVERAFQSIKDILEDK